MEVQDRDSTRLEVDSCQIAQAHSSITVTMVSGYRKPQGLDVNMTDIAGCYLFTYFTIGQRNIEHCQGRGH